MGRVGPIGKSHSALGDGAVMNLHTGKWRRMATSNAPSPRSHPAAVWTGKKLIVWGGVGRHDNKATKLTDGAVYDPKSNTWTPMTAQHAPTGRHRPIALWTGSQMLMMGGGPIAIPGGATGAGDAFLYHPRADTWTEVANAPRLLGEQKHWIRTFVIPNKHVIIVDNFRFQVADLDLKAGKFVDSTCPLP